MNKLKFSILIILSSLLTSCLSFNKPDSSSNSPKPAVSESPVSFDTNKKIDRALANINGESFSLNSLKTLVLTSSQSEKFSNTTIVVLGDGKKILASGLASMINNKKINIDKEYSFFQIKEKYKSKVISSNIKNSPSDNLNYRLSL